MSYRFYRYFWAVVLCGFSFSCFDIFYQGLDKDAGFFPNTGDISIDSDQEIDADSDDGGDANPDSDIDNDIDGSDVEPDSDTGDDTDSGDLDQGHDILTPTWIPLGNGSGISEGAVSNISLYVSNGTPYVAFLDNYFSYNGTGRVMMYNGNNTDWDDLRWTNRFSANGTNPHILMDGFNGIPYIVYSEHHFSYYAWIDFYNGTSWESLFDHLNTNTYFYSTFRVVRGADGETIPIYAFNNISDMNFQICPNLVCPTPYYRSDWHVKTAAIKDNGTTYVAFTNGSSLLSVLKTNGSFFDNVILTDIDGSFPSLAFNGSELYLAYKNGSGFGDKVQVMKWNGYNWHNIGENISTGLDVKDIHLFFNGVPYVAFAEKNGSHNFQAAVMRYNGFEWSYLEPPRYVSEEDVSGITLYVDSGTPYIAYTDDFCGGKLIVKYFK